jgi:hypothetical protein
MYVGSSPLEGTLWQSLTPQHRECLLRYGRFLLQEQEATAPSGMDAVPAVPPEPLLLPVPSGESSVQALKRLKKSYFMLEADGALLGQASQLLMERVFGTPDAEVIGKLEQLFQAHYQRQYGKDVP